MRFNFFNRKRTADADDAAPGILSKLKSVAVVSANETDASSENDSPRDKGASRAARRNRSVLRWPGKGVIMFILSMGMGLFGAIYSRSYIENKVDYYRGQLEKTEEMVQVVVPKVSLRRGQKLVSELLSLRSIPLKYADSNALTEANFNEALEQQLAFDIDEGRPLLWAHLEGGRSPTFSGMVPSGSRALTVRVDEINSISGFLQPQDKIDLLMTYGSGSNNTVFPLLQQMEVIATGVQTQVVKNGDLASKRAFNTITVNVSPENAQKITLAQKIGKLTAVLRNPEDTRPLANTPMTTARLFNKRPKPKKPKVAPRKKDDKPTIEYIIGGV